MTGPFFGVISRQAFAQPRSHHADYAVVVGIEVRTTSECLGPHGILLQEFATAGEVLPANISQKAGECGRTGKRLGSEHRIELSALVFQGTATQGNMIFHQSHQISTTF